MTMRTMTDTTVAIVVGALTGMTRGTTQVASIMVVSNGRITAADGTAETVAVMAADPLAVAHTAMHSRMVTCTLVLTVVFS